MELPRALAPWAPYLDVFPPEIGLALGPLVRRVALALGPLAIRAGIDGSEPDGFDGLSRRGSYERLMASELALADEYPDEFARRAAMGEHLFYRLALRSPVRSRMSVALFDAGPNQLGSPRIAHLAALVALTRRAEAAGARFGWSVLERPDVPLFSEVTTENVMRLLDLRSTEEATEAHVARWRERLEEWADLDDVWLVGGARLGRLAATHGLSRLDVADPCDPASRHLDLTVRAGTAAPRAVRLELPDDRSCARLLRDPFEVATGASVRTAKTHARGSNLLFDPTGTKLFARGAGGGVIAYPVPNSPRAGVGRPKVYGPYPGTVIAAGRAFRKVVTVSVHSGLFLVSGEGGKRGLPARGYYMLTGGASEPEPGSPLGSVHLVAGAEGRGEALVLDPSGVMLRLSPGLDGVKTFDGRFVTGTAVVTATRVLAVAHRFSNLVFVGCERPDDPIRLVSVGASIAREDVAADGEPVEAFFGFGGPLARPSFGLVALRYGATRWRILTSNGPHEHILSADSRVVGVAVRSSNHRVAGLLTVGDGERTISLETREWRKPLVSASRPIVSVAASTSSPTIAYSTEGGDVVIWSLPYATALCRFSTEEAP